METFINDIKSIYDLANEKDENKMMLIDINLLSLQYLAYYLYRIFAKFYNIFEFAIPSKDINQLYKLLNIPVEHDHMKAYPLAGKMTNDKTTLETIILLELEMFDGVDKYIQTLPTQDKYNTIYDFVKTKPLEIIIQDIIDLQKLITGLSISAIRPNYTNNADNI